jgi:hypothetical protein
MNPHDNVDPDDDNDGLSDSYENPDNDESVYIAKDGDIPAYFTMTEAIYRQRNSDIDSNGISDAIEPLINNEMRFDFQPDEDSGDGTILALDGYVVTS